MKKIMSLASLLAAVVMFAGCCNMCGDKKSKKVTHKKAHHKKAHHNKAHHDKGHYKKNDVKKGGDHMKKIAAPVKKTETEFQKIRREADHLIEEI